MIMNSSGKFFLQELLIQPLRSLLMEIQFFTWTTAYWYSQILFSQNLITKATSKYLDMFTIKEDSLFQIQLKLEFLMCLKST